jgi:hypothetical protein
MLDPGGGRLIIRDHVTALPQPSVVRLTGRKQGESNWIQASFYATPEIQTSLSSLEKTLAYPNGCGIFLIGHYGSGKSHFLAYVDQLLRQGNWAPRAIHSVPISLLNYKSVETLESILERELRAQTSSADRRFTWETLSSLHPEGLFILLDELSEFLRSKPSRQAFNEDIRFLQFLGEWAQDHPFWILAALQEQIEHAGDMELELYRKIKDRYPVRYLLTATHVRELISGRILRKAPSYGAAVEKLAGQLKETFPEGDFPALCEIYPLHPTTLELLEEVRDRFSQARGIIDFTLTRLLGNEAKGISPFLDQPWGSLITPDLIIDHFADLFEVQPEFLPISQKILPYYRKHMTRIFEKKPQQELAWRLVKLLILVHLSPSRQYLDSRQAALWLLFKVTTVDPAKNLEVVKKTLDRLAQEGSYIKHKDSHYWLDLEDRSREDFEKQMAKAREELGGRGEGIFEMLMPLLAGSDFNLFQLPRDRWQNRKIRWHFHDRDVAFFLGGGIPPAVEDPAMQIGLPWGPPPQGNGCYCLTPQSLEVNPELLDLAALLYLKDKPLPPPVRNRIAERLAGRTAWFLSLIRTAYAEASLRNPMETSLSSPLERRFPTFAVYLSVYGEWILRHTFPSFEQYAPTAGPLPREAFRRLMREYDTLCSEEATDLVRLVRESYLVPLGLLQRRGAEYVIPPKLENHELIRLLSPVLEHHPSVNRVYELFSAPPLGLVPDQIHLLLIQLLLQGELDILKGQRSYRETFEALPDPISYEKVVPGRALNAEQLQELQSLCEGLNLRVPKQWTVLAQKHAVGQLRQTGRQQRDQLSRFLSRLQEQEGTETLAQRVDHLLKAWLALEKGEHELQGFQHFLYAIHSAAAFLEVHREISALPSRFESLFQQLQRFRHLLSYPCWEESSTAEVRGWKEKLGAPPSLAEPEKLELWLNQANELYENYRAWYAQEHSAWWQKVKTHPIWSYQLPSLARCRQAGLGGMVLEIESIQARASRERCAGLASLDFQPFCRCAYDGNTSPIAGTLETFESARLRLEQELLFFFQQDRVKQRVRQWCDQQLELNTSTLSYLEGQREFPEVENLELFEKFLGGTELVKTLDGKYLLQEWAGHCWDAEALHRQIDQLFQRMGPRIRFQPSLSSARSDLAIWCLEMSLRHGSPLPAGLSREEKKQIASSILPAWIQPVTLTKLEELALDEEIENRVLTLLLEGRFPLPAHLPPRGVVRAIFDLLERKKVFAPEELSSLSWNLYSHHQKIRGLAGLPWKQYLDETANSLLPHEPGELAQILRENSETSWLLIDCLGLPLLPSLKELFPALFPHWKLGATRFAQVSPPTSTDHFHQELFEKIAPRPFEKILVVDEVLHAAGNDFEGMLKRMAAEMEIACRQMMRRLEPAQALLVFADHGFRLSEDGEQFCHGGKSALERLVPIFFFEPR